MEMTRYTVPCECGIGGKDFRKASPMARHPGRFYYCCPEGCRTCTFVWADELWSPKYRHLHADVVVHGYSAMNGAVYGQPRPTTQDPRNYGQSSITETGETIGRNSAISSTINSNRRSWLSSSMSYESSSPPVDVVCCLIGTLACICLVLFIVLVVVVVCRF